MVRPERALRAQVLARRVVERRPGLVVARDQHRLGRTVPRDRLPPVGKRRVGSAWPGVRVDAVVLLGPGQVALRAAVVQLGERAALVAVALTHHLAQALRADALGDLAHPPARPHRRQLPGVADRDHLRAGALGEREQPLAAARGGHPGLVEQHDGALGKLIAGLEVKQRAVKRPRRDAGLLGELTHRAAGRRRPR